MSLRLLLVLALSGCFPRGPELLGEADPNECDETFDDHTHVGAIDVATFERLLEVHATGTMFRWVGSPDRYAFELAFVDEVTSEDLHAVHATLEAALQGGEPLFWRAVSPAQGELATRIESDSNDSLHGRMLRLGEEPP